MRVAIGIDPSLTATGICAIDLDTWRVVEWTCIKTAPDSKYKATEDLARRLLLLAKEVRTFCARHGGIIVIEGQVGSSFGKGSAMSSVGLLMAAYGAVLGSLPTKPVVIHSATVKSRIGKKDASKQEVWDIARVHLLTTPDEMSSKGAREACHDAAVMVVAAMPEIDQLMAMMPSV